MPLAVHVKLPSGWQRSVHIHYWDTSPADPATTWPGLLIVLAGVPVYFLWRKPNGMPSGDQET